MVIFLGAERSVVSQILGFGNNTSNNINNQENISEKGATGTTGTTYPKLHPLSHLTDPSITHSPGFTKINNQYHQQMDSNSNSQVIMNQLDQDQHSSNSLSLGSGNESSDKVLGSCNSNKRKRDRKSERPRKIVASRHQVHAQPSALQQQEYQSIVIKTLHHSKQQQSSGFSASKATSALSTGGSSVEPNVVKRFKSTQEVVADSVISCDNNSSQH